MTCPAPCPATRSGWDRSKRLPSFPQHFDVVGKRRATCPGYAGNWLVARRWQATNVTGLSKCSCECLCVRLRANTLADIATISDWSALKQIHRVDWQIITHAEAIEVQGARAKAMRISIYGFIFSVRSWHDRKAARRLLRDSAHASHDTPRESAGVPIVPAIC